MSAPKDTKDSEPTPVECDSQCDSPMGGRSRCVTPPPEGDYDPYEEESRLAMLKCAHRLGMGLPDPKNLCASAAARGHLKILAWARSVGCT